MAPPEQPVAPPAPTMSSAAVPATVPGLVLSAALGPGPGEEDMPISEMTEPESLHDSRNDVELGSADDASAKIDIETVASDRKPEHLRYMELLREVQRFTAHKQIVYSPRLSKTCCL